MGRGWSAAAPHDDLVLAPMSDGGPGFLDVLGDALGGQTLAAIVEDPTGRRCRPGCSWSTMAGPGPRTWRPRRRAAGPGRRPRPRDPAHTSSFGLGELLLLALSTEPRRVVVGVAGSAVHDAGAGLLAALGAGDRDVLAAGGLALTRVTTGDLPGLSSVVHRFRAVELVLATSATLPLLGFQGGERRGGRGPGATKEEAQALEAAFGHWVDVVTRVLPQPRDLLGGGARRLDRDPRGRRRRRHRPRAAAPRRPAGGRRTYVADQIGLPGSSPAPTSSSPARGPTTGAACATRRPRRCPSWR